MSPAVLDTSVEKMPQGVHHYDVGDDVPENTRRYWHQRLQIFSKYDEGIWLTDDAWFGTTPEPIARKIADHVAAAAPANKTTLIDAFAGAGGNTIAFALSGRWERIFAVERDETVLACAKHNAAIYGVEKKIWWIHGDCFDIIRKRFSAMSKEAVIFASPPWGGPGYRFDTVFDLNVMEPYSLDTLIAAFSKITSDVVLYLPRTSDLNQLAEYVSPGRQIHVIHYCIDGASKALCAYYGNFKFSRESISVQDSARVRGTPR